MGLFYRSDHWSFVREGVPGAWFFFGREFIGQPAEYFEEVVTRYVTTEYHKPADVYHEEWQMGGLLQQVEYTIQVTQLLCSRPTFYPKLKPIVATTSTPVCIVIQPAGKKPSKVASISFGLRCFDCKIEGCVCFL